MSARIGPLNRAISFQAQSTTQDALGQPINTWNTVYECFASISILSGQLLYSTAEFIEKNTWKITFRWTNMVQIVPSMRIVYVDYMNVTHTYEIQSVYDPDQSYAWLVALCYELNSAQ